jgi:hypothetical protein
MEPTSTSPPRSPAEEHRRQVFIMRGKVVAVLAVVCLFYAYLVVPAGVVNLVTGSAEKVSAVVARLFGGIGLTTLFSFVFFAVDPLRLGVTPTAKWFRGRFPSGLAKEKFSISDGEAAGLWFRYFDTWSNPRSPHGEVLRRNYEATFGARAVWYSQNLLFLLAVLIGATIPINHLFFDVYNKEDGRSALGAHLLLLLIYVGVAVFLKMTNRIGTDPSGCFRNISIEFSRQSAMFKHEVLDHARTFPEAVARVQAIEDGLKSERNDGIAPPIEDGGKEARAPRAADH